MEKRLANINERDINGDTPLMKSAMYCRNTDIPLYLLQQGADVSIRNCNSQTALHLAVRNRCEIAKEIIHRGADINVSDKYGYTPLHEAVLYSNYEAICMLLYYNADASAVCKQLITPFMLAVHKNVDLRIQKLLLNYEIDINRTCRAGCNSLLLALDSGSEIILDLLERGANVNEYSEGKNALDLVLQHSNTSYLKKIFSTFDYDVAIASGCDPILFTLFGRRIEAQEWYEILTLMLYSESGEKIVRHCADFEEEMFLSRLIQEFFNRKFSQEQLVTIIAVCLSYDVKIYISNCELAFERFGNGEVFKMLMQHNIIVNRIIYPTLPLLIADTKNTAAHYLNNYTFSLNTKLIDTHLKNVKLLLKFSTPSKKFKEKLQWYVSALDTMHEDYDEVFKGSEDYQIVIETVKKMLVPTLKELSRDASRLYISSCFGAGTSTFYTTVKYVNIPEVVRNIIRYQKALN